MSVGAILTLGLGSFGSVHLLPTLGYLSSDEVTQSTGGWIRRSYEEWQRRQAEADERARTDDARPVDDPRLREYAEKSRKLAAGIERIRAERRAAEAEVVDLKRRISDSEAKRRRRDIAEAERALLLKEQAMQLAAVQEAALLDELQVIDIAYVSIITLGVMLQ